MRAFSRIVAASWILLIAAPVASGAESVRWEADFETAVQKAAQQNRLVLVHFWSDGCPPCEAVERNVFPNPQVAQAINANYVAVKVHAQRRRDLAQRYGVQAWPTDVIVTPTGEKVGQYISPQNPTQYSNLMHQVAAREAVRLRAPSAAIAQVSNNQPSGMDPRNSTFPLASHTGGPAGYGQPGGGEFPLNPSQSPAAGPYDSAYRGGNAPPQQPYSPPSMQPQGAPMFAQSMQTHPTSPQQFQPSPQPAQASSFGGQFSPQSPYMGGGLAMNTPNAPFNAGPQASVPPQGNTFGQFHPSAQGPVAQAPPGGQPAAPQNPPVAPAASQFALDGYCVVSLVEQLHLPVEQQKWRKGDPRWGAVHQAKRICSPDQVNNSGSWPIPTSIRRCSRDMTRSCSSSKVN